VTFPGDDGFVLLKEDLVTALGTALDQTGVIIQKVTPDQASSPTPCSSWDVRTLVNHIVHDVRGFTESTEGGAFRQGDDDVIGDDWVTAYGDAAAELLAVWDRPGATEGMVTLSFGEVPKTWLMGQQIADLAVHAWDVAKATGRSTDLDAGVGGVALEWGRANLLPQFRGDEASGKVFGPEVAVPDDAPLYDRVAAFFGRDPGVWA
jgi:uncharacterized protein (TIGR03086 family)